jgi:hypothetical protein
VPTYDDVPILAPGYQDAQLPVLEEWIGAIGSTPYDRNQCVKLMTEGVSNEAVIQEHTSTNRKMYSVNEDDERA